MSPTVDKSSEPLSQQASELENLDSQITGIRQLIGALQSELTDLERRRNNIERQHEPISVLPSTPPVPASAGSEPMRPRVQGRWAVLIAVVLSLLLVYGGQLVLRSTHRDAPDEGLKQALAGGMLIAGALVFGAFMPRASNLLSRLEFPVETSNSSSYPWRTPWTLGWLSAAIVLAIVGIILFITRGESLTLIIIWLASMLALVIAQMHSTRITRPRIVVEERMYVVALIGLLIITLITRVYRLTTLPYNIDGDFASVGLQARALLTGEQKHIFAYGWAAIPMIGYFPAALGMGLFGNNLAGLNASGVIEGLLVIVGVFMLGRDLFHIRVGLIAATLLTISYTHLAASRQSVYIDPVVFLLFAIYFLFVGLREDRGGAIVTSGLLTALCAQVYYPSRIIVFIVGFMLLYLLLFRRRWLLTHWWILLLWVLAVLITLGPMLVVFIRDFNGFMARTRTVFILSPEMLKHLQAGYHVETIPEVLLQQARRAIFMFHYYVDNGTQFAFRRPFLDPFTAPLFTLGIGYALFHWRRFGHALVITWTVLVVFTGCFLTGDSPYWPRLMVLLPPTALLAALALNVIYELANDNLENIGSLARPLVTAAAALCLIVVGIVNWNTYIEMEGTYASRLTRISRYLADQPPSTRAYLISADYTPKVREFEFLVPGRLVASLTPAEINGDIPHLGTPTLLILTSEQSELVQRLQQRFPSGSIETHAGNSPNEVAFYVFELPE